MIFIRRSVLTTVTLLGILTVIYLMTTSNSTSIEQSLSNISNLSKEDVLKFTKQDTNPPSTPDLKKMKLFLKTVMEMNNRLNLLKLHLCLKWPMKL